MNTSWNKPVRPPANVSVVSGASNRCRAARLVLVRRTQISSPSPQRRIHLRPWRHYPRRSLKRKQALRLRTLRLWLPGIRAHPRRAPKQTRCQVISMHVPGERARLTVSSTALLVGVVDSVSTAMSLQIKGPGSSNFIRVRGHRIQRRQVSGRGSRKHQRGRCGPRRRRKGRKRWPRRKRRGHVENKSEKGNREHTHFHLETLAQTHGGCASPRQQPAVLCQFAQHAQVPRRAGNVGRANTSKRQRSPERDTVPKSHK
jgi:hypothetical protein